MVFPDAIHRLLGSSVQPLLMMLCVVRHGIILVVVGARLKQSKGLPHLCVGSVERLRSSALQSKIYTYIFRVRYTSSIHY